MSDLDALVDEWLPLPDVAERLGTDVGKVRRMLQDQRLLALPRGERHIVSVPAQFLSRTADGWEVVAALQGTLVLLADAGLSAEQAVRWLFTPDPSLRTLGTGPQPPETPIQALSAGHKTEIRRRAQAEAF